MVRRFVWEKRREILRGSGGRPLPVFYYGRLIESEGVAPSCLTTKRGAGQRVVWSCFWGGASPGGASPAPLIVHSHTLLRPCVRKWCPSLTRLGKYEVHSAMYCRTVRCCTLYPSSPSSDRRPPQIVPYLSLAGSQIACSCMVGTSSMCKCQLKPNSYLVSRLHAYPYSTAMCILILA